MKTIISLDIETVIERLAEDCCVDSETLVYVLCRFRHEGIPFLTKTLPTLAKALVEGLEAGRLLVPTAFASRKRNSPKYFKGLFCQVFHLSTGIIREDASAAAIYNIRQFCEYFYKVAFAFDDDQLLEAEKKYLQTERELSMQTLDFEWTEALRKSFESNYSELACAEPHNVFEHSRPRFGPGSFSGSSSLPWKYWIFKALKTDIVGLTAETFKAFSGYFKSYPSAPEAINIVEEHKTCEVEFVPKDSRGPRTISKEPPFLVKGQMAFFDWFSSGLQKATRGRVQFTDQSVNRLLAKSSSSDRHWATLDLKDASDRVSFVLASRVFERSPALRYFVNNARSTHAKMKVSGDTIPVHKLSGMGSGLTFPIMACLIHLSICTSICLHTGITYRKVKELVYVYGDDVIVPSKWYNFAISGLARSGLLVNKQKSFVRGFFRESCGGDYYRGQDVTPARLRLSSCDLPSASSIKPTYVVGLKTYRAKLVLPFNEGALQLERHCRQLILKGNSSLASYYYKVLERVLGPLPTVYGESPVLGRYEPHAYTDSDKTVKAWKPVTVTQDGPSELLCPYKYLASFLKASRDDTCLDNQERRLEFGEVAVPRSIILRKQLVYGVERR